MRGLLVDKPRQRRGLQRVANDVAHDFWRRAVEKFDHAGEWHAFGLVGGRGDL
jgi:hypothetical protein